MITLFQDKVLIRPVSKGEKPQSLIELPENAVNYEPFEADVLSTGPGKVFIELDKSTNQTRVKGAGRTQLKVGQRVLVRANTDYPVKLNGEWLKVVRESDIYGIVERGAQESEGTSATN